VTGVENQATITVAVTSANTTTEYLSSASSSGDTLIPASALNLKAGDHVLVYQGLCTPKESGASNEVVVPAAVAALPKPSLSGCYHHQNAVSVKNVMRGSRIEIHNQTLGIIGVTNYVYADPEYVVLTPHPNQGEQLVAKAALCGEVVESDAVVVQNREGPPFLGIAKPIYRGDDHIHLNGVLSGGSTIEVFLQQGLPLSPLVISPPAPFQRSDLDIALTNSPSAGQVVVARVGFDGMYTSDSAQIIAHAPLAASLIPDHVVQGNAAFTIQVKGQYFDFGAVVLWNGAARPTSPLSTSLLQSSIGAADVSASGYSKVRIRNTDGQESTELTFRVEAVPAATITLTVSISVAEGDPAFLSRTINGASCRLHKPDGTFHENTAANQTPGTVTLSFPFTILNDPEAQKSWYVDADIQFQYEDSSKSVPPKNSFQLITRSVTGPTAPGKEVVPALSNVVFLLVDFVEPNPPGGVREWEVS
jgi:hypothetical protein